MNKHRKEAKKLVEKDEKEMSNVELLKRLSNLM